MRFFFNCDQKVSRGTSPEAGISLAAHTELQSFIHACRDIDCNSFFIIDPAVTLTVAAFCSNGRTLSLTGRANHHCLHLSQKSRLNLSDLTRSVTRLTGFYT